MPTPKTTKDRIVDEFEDKFVVNTPIGCQQECCKGRRHRYLSSAVTYQEVEGFLLQSLSYLAKEMLEAVPEKTGCGFMINFIDHANWGEKARVCGREDVWCDSCSTANGLRQDLLTKVRDMGIDLTGPHSPG